MRLKERRLTQICILPRAEVRGELGGISEGFASEGTIVRASCLPEGGELEGRSYGAACPEKKRFLVAGDVQVKAGDGVRTEDGNYRILSVQRWSTQIELVCGAII